MNNYDNDIGNGNGQFDGKVAFVTGAGSGIGRATAIAFATQGARVIAADRNPDDNDLTVDLINEHGGTAIATTCDVTSSDDVQSALRLGIERFGRLDIAFNNAGVELRPTPAADISEDDWARVLDINLRGIFLCMKYEIPLARRHRPPSDAADTRRARRVRVLRYSTRKLHGPYLVRLWCSVFGPLMAVPPAVVPGVLGVFVPVGRRLNSRGLGLLRPPLGLPTCVCPSGRLLALRVAPGVGLLAGGLFDFVSL